MVLVFTDFWPRVPIPTYFFHHCHIFLNFIYCKHAKYLTMTSIRSKILDFQIYWISFGYHLVYCVFLTLCRCGSVKILHSKVHMYLNASFTLPFTSLDPCFYLKTAIKTYLLYKMYFINETFSSF